MDCLREAARSTPVRRDVAGAGRPGKPVAVPSLIVANVVVFVLTVIDAGGSITENFRSWLFLEGALVPTAVAQGDWWRIGTSAFLHVGPMHLLFNMFALFIIGREVETVLGRARFLAVYGVALLGGSAAVMLFSDSFGPTAGASGAVFGLMGALVVLLRRLRMPINQVLVLIGINVVIGFVIPGVSWQGHVGGLLFGAATAAALVYPGARSPYRRQLQLGAVGGLVVLALVLVGAGIVLL